MPDDQISVSFIKDLLYQVPGVTTVNVWPAEVGQRHGMEWARNYAYRFEVARKGENDSTEEWRFLHTSAEVYDYIEECVQVWTLEKAAERVYDISSSAYHALINAADWRPWGIKF